jgi:hypothetical protein
MKKQLPVIYTSYMTAERYDFPPRIWSQKGEWCKCSKGHTIGIVIVANGNVEAVRLRT